MCLPSPVKPIAAHTPERLGRSYFHLTTWDTVNRVGEPAGLAEPTRLAGTWGRPRAGQAIRSATSIAVAPLACRRSDTVGYRTFPNSTESVTWRSVQ